MELIKVLVVDDSAFMRKVLSDIINSDPTMTVVAAARDGQDALQKIDHFKPDVITLDIEMPIMDGMQTLEKIMTDNPLPVIMVSSLTQSGAEHTIRALNLGAVDFIAKPSGQISLDIDKISGDILKKIKIAAGTKKKLPNINNISDFNPISSAVYKENVIDSKRQLNKLVLIGTSTGGPKALHQVLPKLPANINAGILVVQHMPPGFTKSLADRLNSLSQIKVKEAENGEEVLTGCAYIAPGDFHLNVLANREKQKKELFIKLTQESPQGGHRPSVNQMLQSVAGQFWSDIVCVIMTGMGQDGTAGLKYIKDKGAKVIAEHQSSCVVYGMPKVAIESGLVDKVVPLSNISEEVTKMLQ
ncbi:MAG: chemotaxis response regulator protein-glutamate methylesterase [Firmicutes bacterium HGW-Firmicutes-15]|nr:MAG: chemotaxis response regulator protein-glutamate methylesterase [Firmicutes bacterium HGW-Firmicutes-15]